jgi:uncharacterized membrane protein YhaH (DUF805 family)
MPTAALFNGSELGALASSPLAGILFAFYVLSVVVIVYAGVRVLSQAGYSGWWIVVVLVPILNLVMFLVFAFSKWPVREQLEAYQQGDPRRGDPGGPGYGGGYGT